MRFRLLALSILITATLGGTLVSTPAPTVEGQSIFLTVPQPNASALNQVIDFYAGGTSGGYSIRVSPQGGTVSLSDYYATNVMPWGYVTAQWTSGRVYIIFLVNVTETNFRIGFLYLTNSTGEAFILRWYDYQDDSLSTFTFQGAQHVYDRTVPTTSVQLSKLQIPLSTAASNDLYAIGPRLYLNSLSGLLSNGTSQLRIHPFMNQLFQGPTDYNEVWSLLADQIGNYYFGILYMRNNDTSHVIIEHQLRLNDYRRLDGQTLDARWTRGEFPHEVIVRTPVTNLTVKIDGFPFLPNNNKVVSAGVPSGLVTVEVPNETVVSGSKLRFASWGKYGSSNPLSVVVNSTLDLTAKYDYEYPLVVASAYGNPQGAGWYLSGTNATFSVDRKIDYGNGTRQVFQQWTGDSNSTDHEAWTIVNAPKQVSALWSTQFRVTLTAVGLPGSASSTIVIGNTRVVLNGSQSAEEWVGANQQVPVTVETTQIQGDNSNYVFSELRTGNQPFEGNVDVIGPVDVSVVYVESAKQAASLNLQVAPSVALPGFPLSITGSLAGFGDAPTTVDLFWSSAGGEWQELAIVPVGQDGAFTYNWQTSNPGDYSIKAVWAGDATHTQTSKVAEVRVVASSGSNVGGSDFVTQLLRAGLTTVKNIPYLSVLISFAASLMTLGYVVASIFLPGAPAILGSFIGSAILGFTFVFPVTAAIVLARAAKTKHRPRLVWISPLLIIWVLSLALVFVGPLLLIPQSLVVVSQVVLLASNVLALPMVFSFRLASLVA